MYVIDRIENNFVVCEKTDSGNLYNFYPKIFPEGIKEGDSFEIIDGKAVITDNSQALQRIQNKMKLLWQ